VKKYLSDALKRGLGVIEAPTPRVEEKKQETPKESENNMSQNQDMFDPKSRMANRQNSRKRGNSKPKQQPIASEFDEDQFMEI
jgi:hypothetical protein